MQRETLFTFHQGLLACLPDIIQQDNSIVLLLKVANKQLRSRALELPFFFLGGGEEFSGIAAMEDTRPPRCVFRVQVGSHVGVVRVTFTEVQGDGDAQIWRDLQSFFYSGGGDKKT